AGSMATTSCPSSFKVSGSPTGSKSPPTPRPRNHKPPPPDPSGHHQDSAIAPGQPVQAVVNVLLDALLAGDAVRVSGLGVFNVAARPVRQGRNPQTGESIE